MVAMGFDEGRIVLNNPNNTYNAGETIYGKLEFQQTTLKTFRGIYVKIKGFAHVNWKTSHTRRVNDRTEHYTVDHTAHEDYFSVKQYLVGDDHGENHLQPGNYSFDFQCPIPAHCPSSFEHKYGHIRYKLKIVVDRAFKFDQEKEMSIRVIAPLDLNQNPYCREPMVFSFEEIYCCCCMSSGICEILVKLPVAGYCPGQIMPVELHCSNKSSVVIERIKLALIKKMKFTANHYPDTKYDTDQIIEIKKGPVNGSSTRNWTVEIEVPYIDIYNVDACQFIDIDYEFKVTVVPDGCHSDSTDTKRIILGTIPLVGYQDNAPNPHDQMVQAQVTEHKTMSHQTQNYANENAIANLLYPGSKLPYPPADTLIHGNVPSYPGFKAPYTNTPYPNPSLGVPPYPPTNLPYPDINSSPKANLPYPANPPYPVTDAPFPNPNPGLGFRVQGIEQSSNLPPMPLTNNLSPSAPEPSTPDDDKKPAAADYGQRNTSTSNYTYPYNPEFMTTNK